MGLIRGTRGSQQPSFHSDGIPADFYNQILWGLLFLALVLWAEELNMGLEPLVPQQGPPQLSYPS